MLSKEKLFYAAILPFLVFFALFPVFVYPNRALLCPTTSADWLQSVLPAGMKGLVGCYRNWDYSLFYILSELWGSAILSLGFWGFANDIMRINEAKRVYTLLGVGANVALLVSGPMITYFSQIRGNMPVGADPWQISLNYLMGSVVFAGAMIVGIYWWMHRSVLTDPKFYDPKDVKQKKEKPKMSIVESFKFLLKSRYIFLIALLVMSYGICINLVEVTWKGQLKLQYPNPNDYSAFMGGLSFATGATTICLMFIGGWLMRRFGWRFAAMATPVMLLVTASGFFAFVIFSDSLHYYVAALGTTPLFLAVIIGMIQNVLSKSTKYSLFDPTKEMAYIPLDQESKVKGKAAIDVVGARLGKSGGSAIQQVLLVAVGSLGAITPYVAGSVIAVMVAWMLGVRSLSRMFAELTGQKEEVSASAETATQAAT